MVTVVDTRRRDPYGCEDSCSIWNEHVGAQHSYSKAMSQRGVRPFDSRSILCPNAVNMHKRVNLVKE